MPIPLQELYEEFNRRIDKPHEFNRLLSSVIADLYTSIQGQNIVWDNGVPYIFDPLRQKNLSLTRTVISSALYGDSITNTYLRLDGVATMAEQGFLLPRNATITGLWAKSRTGASWSLEVRKNGLPMTLVSQTISLGSGYGATIDLDVNQGDWIQLYLNGSGVKHPIGVCELAWRL